jgi:hypothetical protein
MADNPTRGGPEGLLGMLSNPDDMFAPINYMSPTTNPFNDPANPQYNPRMANDIAQEAQAAHESSLPYQEVLQQRHSDAAEGHGVSPEVLAFMDQGLISAWGEPGSYNLGPNYGDTGRLSGTPMDSAGLDWSGGTPSNWKDFDNHNTSTGGGFFTMDELFGDKLPTSFQAGSSLLSTNNWRLLPSEYRRPGYIMRNGRIIDTNSPTMFGPLGSGSLGDAGPAPSWRSGAGAGVPSAYSPGSTAYGVTGWPGQMGGWGMIPAS